MGIQRKHISASNHSNDFNVVIFDLRITIKDDYLSTAWCAGNLPHSEVNCILYGAEYLHSTIHTLKILAPSAKEERKRLVVFLKQQAWLTSFKTFDSSLSWSKLPYEKYSLLRQFQAQQNLRRLFWKATTTTTKRFRKEMGKIPCN